MRRLPNINLTESDIRNLNLDTLFNYGGEADIFRNNNPHTLYKIFPITGMSDNKFEKLKILYQKSPKDKSNL